MNILFVSAYTPSRIRVRPYNFIKALAQRGHDITLVCGATPDDAAALEELGRICQRVVTVETSKLHMGWNALRAIPGSLPLQAALSFGAPLLNVVRQEANRSNAAGLPYYDVAHIEHLRASALAYALQPIPTVLDAVDSISLLFERALRGSPSLKSRIMALVDLARTRHYEAHYTAHYDEVLVSSPEDAWALRELARTASEPVMPEHIHVVPNGVDLTYFAPQQVERWPATLVFSGKMSYHANVAAVLLLVHEIMPRVWAQRPDVRVVITGSAPTREVRALAADLRVEVTGYVDDLRSYLAQATIAISPLRYAVGIQNKVLEAMAMGAPVIAARQVARALHTEDRVNLILAQDVEEYAQAVLTLLQDDALRASLGVHGRHYVEYHHDWNSAAARLEQIYTAAMDKNPELAQNIAHAPAMFSDAGSAIPAT